MSDCVFKQHKIHFNEFRLCVIGLKLIDQIISEFVKVSDLFVNFHVFIEEINEDCILTICLAMLFVIHLELQLNLLSHEALELITIFKRVKAIVEYSQDLVAPKLYDVLFALIEVFVSLV